METKNGLLCLMIIFTVVSAESDPNNAQDAELHTETIENGDEKKVTILDKGNNVLGSVEVFEEQGFQIDKPLEDNEHPCLLRKIDGQSEQTDSNDTETCYVRRAISYEEAMDMDLNATHVFDQCRSLYVLEPQDCNVIDDKGTGLSRQKRSWSVVGRYCCEYRTYRSVTCVSSYRKCCKKRWTCIRYCTVCKRYQPIYITVKTCRHY